MSGKVWLVGVGFGDLELLILKVVCVLQDVDVVMVDDLVNLSILEYCLFVWLVWVGKCGGCCFILQDFIQCLMLWYVCQGCSVVCLKGGDLCIFGCVGEEVEWLVWYGIDSEIVNGIIVGLVGVIVCGILLIYCGISCGVILVIVYIQDDSLLVWEVLVCSGIMLVVYMGVV